ncbi:MAG: hypothetical protein IJE83_01350, partial [Oscillospiraceae bacterium]|nr:hypothetical protein [Oscillospiraceae bacterium]
ELFWAYEVEEAVIGELFRMTYLGDEENVKSTGMNVRDSLAEELKKANARLNSYYARLDKIESGESDELPDIVEEKIQEISRQIKSIKAQLHSEDEKQKISRKVGKARELFRTIKISWESMNDKERRNVCQELIDRIIINKNGSIDVHLKLQSCFAGK